MDKFRIITVAVFMILFIASLGMMYRQFVVRHEMVHQKIFEYHGINSTIYYDFLSAYTYPTEPIPDDKYDIVMSLHAVNEMVNYQYSILFGLQCVTMFMIVLMILFQREDHSKDKSSDSSSVYAFSGS